MVFRAGKECWVHWVLEVLKLRLTDEFQEMHRVCALCEKYFSGCVDVFQRKGQRFYQIFEWSQ